MTLEQWWYAKPFDNNAWNRLRKAKIAEIAEEIRSDLKDRDDAEWIAESIMSLAEQHGSFDGNNVHGEISGRHSKSGNPVPVTI
jgi:hypothetical protein